MKKLTLSKIIISLLIITLSTISNAAPELSKLWETKADFKLPESVIYDKENDILYVSNMQDDPFKKDKNGIDTSVSKDVSEEINKVKDGIKDLTGSVKRNL